MRGFRKLTFGFVMGLAYLAVAAILCWRGIEAKMDGVALGAMCTGLATGVASIAGIYTWGNVRTYQAQTEVQVEQIQKDQPAQQISQTQQSQEDSK